MACGCNRGRTNLRQAARPGSLKAANVNHKSMVRKNSPEVRKLMAEKAQQNLENNTNSREKTRGGLDLNRREAERRRRLIILNKLGRI